MAKDHDILARDPLPGPFVRGAYVARFASSAADVAAAQRLRHVCFVQRAGRADLPGRIEADGFDGACDHGLIEDAAGRLVSCFRVQRFATGADIARSYAAQYYDLERFSDLDGPMVELGRFCVCPDVVDADVLRMAWGMLAAYVDAQGAAVLFGCSSFAGTQAAPYRLAFDVLAAHHVAPARFAPQIGAADVVRFAHSAAAVEDRRAAMAQVPSLLKTYLSMGGWVSDHAVVDRQMNTLHVFTALEIAKIPVARARALRAVMG